MPESLLGLHIAYIASIYHNRIIERNNSTQEMDDMKAALTRSGKYRVELTYTEAEILYDKVRNIYGSAMSTYRESWCIPPGTKPRLHAG